MKILIVNRFFGGAQVPTGRMAEDVARVLVEEGHEVSALASTGTYAGAVKQARGQETKRPKDQKTAEQTSEIRSQKSETGNGTLRVETVKVPKWMPRALAWLWFTWQARKCIPRMDWDVCVLMTDPPLLPLLAARAKARGQDTGNRRQSDDSRLHSATAAQAGVTTKRHVAVWLMDLYPEALAASGRIGKSNPIYKWYFEKRQRALSAADLLICLGETQRERLETKRQPEVGGLRPETGDGLHGNQLVKSQEQGDVEARRQGAGDRGQAVGIEAMKHGNTELLGGGPTDRVRTAVVPPWDDRGSIALATEGSLKNLALYAGNLGEAHCFEEILAAAPHLPGDWTIRFAARGAKLAGLKAAASELKRPKDEKTKRLGARIEVTGYVSEEETPELLASARVHLITMSPGWEGIVVPSKLYGCIRTGRPVLFIGPENADTAREICANDWGKVLPPGASGEEVAAAILELAARETCAVLPQRGAAAVAQLLQSLATDGHG